MTIKVSQSVLEAAVKALGLDVPIQAARKSGGVVILTTRDGEYRWKMPVKRARVKAPKTPGGAAKKMGAKK